MSKHIVTLIVELDQIDKGEDKGLYDTSWGPATLIEIQECVNEMINGEEDEE